MELNTAESTDPWGQRRSMFLTGETAPLTQKTLTDEENNFANYGFNYTLGADNEELRAQRQSTGEKFLNATGKAGVLAATTFADGIIGTIVGGANLISKSIEEGTFKGSAFWNNDFTNTMKSWQDWGEKNLPNYYTKAEQDAPWYSQAIGLSEGTANFWSDKVLKNLGFAIGAGAASIVTGQAINSLQGTKDVFNRVARGLAVATEDEKLAASVAYRGGEVVGDLAKDAKLLKQKNFRAQVAGSILGAQAESRFEALNASKEFIENQVNRLVERGYTKDQAEALVAQDKQIQSDALGVGNGTFALNMALLSATGFSEFSEAITKGFNPNKILTNNITVDLEKGLVQQTGKLSAAQTMARKMGKNFISEGVIEEMGQAVVSGTQKDYYNRKYDDNATRQVNSYLDSFVRNLAETYGTAKGWEEGFIGGFSGMIGIPGMPGNLVSQIKEAKKENAQTTEAVNKLKEIMQKPEFKNRYNNIIRDVSINEDKKQALNDNDLFDYNNAEHAAFMNDVHRFIDAGKFSDFIEYMEAAQKLEEGEARKLFNKTITNEDGTTSIVNPLANDTPAQVQERISKNLIALKNKAEKIKEIRENVETKFNTLDRNSIMSLTNMASTIEDVDTRIDKIKNKLAVNAPELTGIIDNLIDAKSSNALDKSNLIDDEVFIDALDEKIKQDPQKYDLYNDAKDLLRLIKRKKDFGEAYLKAVQNPKEFEAYNKVQEREAELANRAGGAKNKYIYDKYTNKDEKFGFDSSEFDVETDEIIPDNTYDVTYVDYTTKEEESFRGVKGERTISKNGQPFIKYTLPNGEVKRIHENNIKSENLVTTKKVTKKVKFQEDTPSKLVDEEGNEYNTADFADQILASEDPSNRQITKNYIQIRKELINKARIKTLQSTIEANNLAITQLQEEINSFKKIAKENLIYLSRALTNKTQKTTVTVDGQKLKKSVAELEQLVIERRNQINDAQEKINAIEKENAYIENSKNDDLNKVYDQYNNLAQDEKNLSLKIKAVKQEIEKASNRLSVLEDIVDRLKKFVINLFDMRKQIPDRYQIAGIEINTKTREANELRELIDAKLKELDFLEKLYVKFEKENSNWENTLIQLIREKNKEVLKDIKANKTSVTEDPFIEIANLSDKEEELKELSTAKKSILNMASTTGIHVANPDTFNAITKLDIERDNVSLRVVTKEIAPELFKEPEELDPSKPAIKVIIYSNGVPVNKNLEVISETDYENMLVLDISEATLQYKNKEFGDKFYDLQAYEETPYEVKNENDEVIEVISEAEHKRKEYQTWRDNIINEVNEGEPKFIYPKDKSQGIIEFDWSKKRTEEYDTTDAIYDTLFYNLSPAERTQAFNSSEIVIPAINKLNGKNVVPGLPYLVYNGNVIPLITRKLNKEEVNVIIDLLKAKEIDSNVYLDSEVKPNTKKTKGKWTKSRVKGGKELDGTKDKNGNVLKWFEEKTGEKEKKKTYRNRKSKRGKKSFYYKKTGRKKGAGLYYQKTETAPRESVNILQYLQSIIYMGNHLAESRNEQTEFYYEAKTKRLVFYDFKELKQVKIPCTAKAIEDNREILTLFLQNKYHQVHKSTLNSPSTKKFNKITKIEGGKIEVEEFTSYKHYLLTNKNKSTERNTNDIPLTTNIADKENPIKSQYFTFESSANPQETGLKNAAKSKKSNKAAPVKNTPKKSATKGPLTLDSVIEGIDNDVFSLPEDEDRLDKFFQDYAKNVLKIPKKEVDSFLASVAQTVEDTLGLDSEISLELYQGVALYLKEDEESEGTAENLEEEIDEEPEVEIDTNVSNNDPFRLATTKEYVEGNYEKAKKWLLERFPNLKVEQVKGLIDNRAFGQALYNAVKLAETFEEGSEYHEAFHITTMMYLSNDELDKLYKEAASLYGNPTVKDIRELQKIYPNLNNTQLVEAYYEEKLAEDFRNYVLTKQKIAPKGLKGLFQKLWNKIKELLGIANHPNIADLFEKIDTGYYKNTTPVYNRLNKYKKNSSLKGLSVSEKHNLVEGIISMVLKNYLQNNSIRTLGYDKSTIKNLTITLKDAFISHFQKNVNHKHIVDLLKNDYKSVLDEIANYFNQFGVELTYDDYIENLEEDTKPKDPFSDSIEFDPEETTSKEIKLLIATLPIYKNGKLELNELGLLKFSEFGSTFNYLSNLLSGCVTYDEMRDKIVEAIPYKPELEILLNRLERTSNDKLDDFLLRQKFTQAFAKTKLEYQQWLIEDDGNIYSTNSTGESQESRQLDNWKVEIAETLAFQDSPIKLVNDIIVFNAIRIADKFKKIESSKTTIEEKIVNKFKTLGIVYTLIPNLTKSDLNKINETLELIVSKGIKTNIALETFFKNESSRLKFLSTFDLGIKDNDVNLQHIGPDGKTRYSISLNNYLTLIGNTFNKLPALKSREALFAEHPYLDNAYTQNSYFFKLNGLLFDELGNKRPNSKFTMSIIEGARQVEVGANGEAIADMKPVDKLWLSVNNILTGSIPFLRASDKSLEFGFKLDKPLFDIENIQEYAVRNQYLTILKGYLKDEIHRTRLLTLNGVGANIKYYKDHASNLYMFKKYITLDSRVLDDKNDGIVDTWMKANESYIERQLDKWINDLSNTNLNKLVKNKIFQKTETGYKNLGISTSLEGVSTKLSNQKAFDICKSLALNSLIANFEQTKLFTGDPAMYKSIEDFYKRTSAAVGTKLMAFDDEYINNFLKRNNKRTDKVPNGRVKCVTSVDVSSSSQHLTEYKKILKTKFKKTKEEIDFILSPYEKMTENDAQGFITLPEYREFLLRTGTYWTHSHEDIYKKALNGDTLTEKELNYFQPLKAQHFGPKAQASYGANSIASMTFLKLSLMPLIPSAIKNTSLEKLNIALLNSGTGIHIADSGTKLGAQLQSDGKGNFFQRPFYNSNGSINTTIAEDATYELYYKFLGIQVEIASSVKSKTSYGTQQRKLILSNIFNEAKSKTMSFFNTKGKVDLTPKELQLEYNKLLNDYVKLELNDLLKRLNVSKQSNGSYIFNDVKNVAKILKDEAISRRAPANLVESIQTLTEAQITSFRNPLDALPNRNKIENILLSLVNNSAIKQKVKGGGKIQGSTSGFENTKREFVKENIVKSTGLKFYREGAYGETLPAQFKMALPKDMIGYMNLVGGLDKLNELLAYAFSEVEVPVEVDGKIKMVIDPNRSPRYNPQLVAKWLYDNQIDAEFNPKLFQFIGYRIPTQGLNSIENGEIIGFLPPESGDLIVVPAEIVAKSGSDFDIDKLNIFLHNFNKKDYTSYSDLNTKEGIFNRLIEINQLVLSSPENFEELITPNSDDVIKSIAHKIRDTKNLALSKNPNSILEWDYIQDIANYFLVGKAGVGQKALHNTSHVLSQQIGVKVNTTFKTPSNKEKSTRLFFKGLENEYSLSAEYDINRTNKITDIISQFINGFVDVAKEPYVFFLNANTSTNDTISYLLRRKVPIQTIANFMVQPIIDEYLSAQSINESMMIKTKGQELDKLSLLNEVQDKYKELLKELNGTYNSDLLFTSEELEESLKYSFNDLPKNNSAKIKWLKIQLQVLDNFITYQEQATVLNDIMSINKPDTTTPKNLNSLYTLKVIRKRVKNANLISQEYINAFKNETMLKGFHAAQEETEFLYTDLFITESKPVKDKLLGLLSLYINTRKSQTDISEVLDLFKNDFITFLYSTANTVKKGKRNTFLSSLIPELFFDKDFSNEANLDVAQRLASFKKSVKYKQDPFLKSIIPLINDNKRSQNNIKFFNKKLTKYKEDMLTETFRNYLDSVTSVGKDDHLFLKLQYVFMLQGGLQNSPVSFLDKIPHEYYSKLVSIALNHFKDNPEIIENFIDQFYRNNYNNTTLVPKSKNNYYKSAEDKFVYDNTNVNSEFPYIKKWIKEENESKIKAGFPKGYWALYKGSKGEKETTFSRVSKLGDGFYLKEYYPTLRPSVIAANNVAEDKFETTKLINKFDTLNEPMTIAEEVTTTTVYPGKPEFNSLPAKSDVLTMTYAGIGSRQTPPEILKQMTQVAKELESIGYTLNTGVTFGGKKEGADKAFDDGTSKKNLFSPENQGSRKKEQAIAKEIHPNPSALSPAALKLMARNTNQVFGDNLNTPVDFVLFYAEETANSLRPKGGTGQAVEMARRKGIPTINMSNPNWIDQLKVALANKSTQPTTSAKTTTTELTDSTVNSLKEAFGMDPEFFEDRGITKEEDFDELLPKQLKELLKKYCNKK